MATKQTASKKVKIDEEQENQQVEEVVEEVVEELPLGEDASALFTNTDEKELEIVHAGRRCIFKYKELTWGEKNACIDESQSWTADGTFEFSISKYYAAALTRMLTTTPIRPITETTLNRLNRVIGEQLVQLVPQPVEPIVPDLKVQ